MKTGTYENSYKTLYQCVGNYMYFCIKLMKQNNKFL